MTSTIPLSSQPGSPSAPLVAKVVKDVGEVPLTLYSDARSPMADMSFLRRSLVLAELAMIAYNDRAESRRAVKSIGFSMAQLLDYDGSQAYWFQNDHDVVVACRGTEPTEWNDIKADANASMAVVGTFGNVHSGFNREVDDLWPLLESMLRDSTRTIWFCGHSLGAAMATICAYRCKTCPITPDPTELHTFGSPRVGCQRYINHAQVNHYRWVHNNDVVTRVPPIWLGYRHGGKEIYFDRFGAIRPLTGVWRSRDRWRGLFSGLLQWKIDLLADHSIHLYIQHIVTAINAEIAALASGRDVTQAHDLIVPGQADEPLPQRSAAA